MMKHLLFIPFFFVALLACSNDDTTTTMPQQDTPDSLHADTLTITDQPASSDTPVL